MIRLWKQGRVVSLEVGISPATYARFAKSLTSILPPTHMLHAPVAAARTLRRGGGGRSVYPEHCVFKKYRGSKPCGHLLVRVAKHGGTKVTPIKPFVVQDYRDFVAGLLSRPGMEEALERGTLLNDKHQLWDIKDGTAITEIQGPDGKIFMDGLKRSDLRLAWSLSIDWFNPQGNRTAGKKKSVGSIAMTILNLPPSLRYKPENVYLVGIIPGQKEPSLEEINHFLRPLVDIFMAAWKVGTWFSKTTAHTMGRLI